MAVFYRIAWCLVAPFVRLFFPTRVIGRENSPKGKAIFACNHRSGMDIVLIDCCRVKRPYVLAKHTLFNCKFFGAILRSFGAIPVNRQDVSTKTIRTAMKVLNEGNHLILFPEGTRKQSLDETAALKNGMALFALKTNSPIVPMYITKKPLPFVFNKLFIGKPLDFSEFEGQRATKEVLNEVSARVFEAMLELRTNYENSLSPKQRERLARKNEKAIARDLKKQARKLEKNQAKGISPIVLKDSVTEQQEVGESNTEHSKVAIEPKTKAESIQEVVENPKNLEQIQEQIEPQVETNDNTTVLVEKKETDTELASINNEQNEENKD